MIVISFMTTFSGNRESISFKIKDSKYLRLALLTPKAVKLSLRHSPESSVEERSVVALYSVFKRQQDECKNFIAR